MKKKAKELLFRLAAFVARDPSPKTVYYHDIGAAFTPMGTPEDLLMEHAALLRKGDSVCFDDGFAGIFAARQNVLAALRSKAEVTVFLAVDLVGRPGYLSWSEIRELHDSFGVDFQCHTWSHQTLAGPWNDEVPVPPAGRTEQWFARELRDSKAELERRLGGPVSALCLPVGYFSQSVLKRCRAAGYEKVYASYPGNASDAFVQPRCLAQDLSPSAFRAVLEGGMNAFEKRYARMHEFPEEQVE